MLLCGAGDGCKEGEGEEIAHTLLPSSCHTTKSKECRTSPNNIAINGVDIYAILAAR